MRPSVLLLAIPLALSMSLTGSAGAPPASLPPPPEQTSARSVSVGYWHHCAITEEGRVRCWGDGHWGELGTGTREYWRRPAAVVGLRGTPVQVVAAERFTCALDDAGQVMCWGSNYSGQLGIGSKVNKRLRPVAVTGLDHPITELSGLDSHICALDDTGTVSCWGENAEGQLGPAAQGRRSRRPLPVELPRLALSISAGSDMSCAILDDNSLWCWGGREGNKPSRVRQNVKQVSAGTGYACLVTRDGSAMCWGRNYLGSLGDGTTDNSRTPVPVTGLSQGVSSIEAGNAITCALLDDDTVRCWGMTGLSEGGAPRYLTPARIIGLGPVDYLDVGLSDVCAVTNLGETRCWLVYRDPIVAVTSPGLEGSSRVVRQPDVQLAATRHGNLRGDGVYNASGLDQTREVGAYAGKAVTFHVLVENDGDETDLFTLDAHATRRSLARTQYTVDGRNVTKQVRYGEFRRVLAPGGHVDVMMTVRLDPDVWPRARLYTTLLARSAHNNAAVDRVQAVVAVLRDS